MKLFLISQTVNNDYDTFDAAVVAAEDEVAARHIHPRGMEQGKLSTPPDTTQWDNIFAFDDWANSPNDVKVIYLAETHLPAGIILASFNAG